MKRRDIVQRTLVFIKPDGVKRGLVGEIISRFERAGLKIVGLKMVWLDEEWARRHYPDEMAERIGRKAKAAFEKAGKPFPWDPKAYGEAVLFALRRYVTSAPIVAMVLEGPYAIDIVRKLVGATNPADSPPGTIRGDFSVDAIDYANEQVRSTFNIVHASDSPEAAEREIAEFFRPEELYEYETLYEYLMSGL